MNIYFACSITGGRQDEDHYQQIVQFLEEEGHHVPTAGLASSEVSILEGALDPPIVYLRDTGWILNADLLIAEVSTPSHGVGYEVGYALQHRKPVLCIYKQGTLVSKMITGNPDPRLTTFAYSDMGSARHFIRDYLGNMTV